MTGTRTWRGLRYATAPHRFARPVLAPLVTTPEPGGRFSAPPVQRLPEGFGDIETTEDSYFLNIWAPAGEGPHKVIVYVYGGGFEGGWAAAPWLEGAALSEAADAVVVTLDHRVGALGWAQLAQHGGLLREASNLGLHDVLRALQWVQTSIDRFGGDPDQVTLSGSSSGAFIATSLLAVPEARGLFRRLAAFSGGASRVVPLATAEAIGDSILEGLGLGDDPDRILAADASSILNAQAAVIPQEIGRRNGRVPYAFGVVDDAGTAAATLSRHPMAAIVAGEASDIPVWFATTRHEVATLRRPGFEPRSTAELEAEVEGIAGPVAHRVLAAYVGDDAQRREQLFSDYIYRLPAARAAFAQAAAGGRATLVDIGPADTERAGHGAEAAGAFAHPRNDRDTELLDGYLAFLSGGTASPGSVHRISVGKADPALLDGTDLTDLWTGVERP